MSGYVAQNGSDGAIGYTQYSFAITSGFPVAKLLNADGYYTEPTPGHVAVSLLEAQINTDPRSSDYLTENLSGVYTDTDPRTYELSAYSYFILPTNQTYPITPKQGYSLGAYGSYLLCQGQQQVDTLGYSALPINLVEAGYAQLRKIPGAQIQSTSGSFIQGCNNPTFDPNGNNKLAETDPQPAACDHSRQGPVHRGHRWGTGQWRFHGHRVGQWVRHRRYRRYGWHRGYGWHREHRRYGRYGWHREHRRYGRYGWHREHRRYGRHREHRRHRRHHAHL